MNGISPQLQNQIAQFQQAQQQLQNVTAQRVQMEAQAKELDRTIAELAKSTGAVYRNVGVLLIKVEDKKALQDELEESKETIEIRVRGIQRQEDGLRGKVQQLQDSINLAMGNAPARPAAAPKKDDDEEED